MPAVVAPPKPPDCSAVDGPSTHMSTARRGLSRLRPRLPLTPPALRPAGVSGNRGRVGRVRGGAWGVVSRLVDGRRRVLDGIAGGFGVSRMSVVPNLCRLRREGAAGCPASCGGLCGRCARLVSPPPSRLIVLGSEGREWVWVRGVGFRARMWGLASVLGWGERARQAAADGFWLSCGWCCSGCVGLVGAFARGFGYRRPRVRARERFRARVGAGLGPALPVDALPARG